MGAPAIKLFLAVFLLMAFGSFASADMGPKPSIQLRFNYDGVPVSDFNARLLACYPPSDAYSSQDLTRAGDGYFSSLYGRSSKEYASEVKAYNISVFDSEQGCYWRPKQFFYSGGEFRIAAFRLGEDRIFVTNPAQPRNFNSVFEVDLHFDGTA